MPNLPDLEAWAIFAKVVELRSFTAAADDLAISKATVSKAVTRLERSLGLQLFHRSSRHLSLTDSGRALAGRAQQLLELGEAAEEAAREDSETPRGMIRLAAPMSFGFNHVAPMLAEFLCDYPEIRIDLHLSDERVDIIAEGFDVALRIANLPDSALRSRRLGDVPSRLVAAPAYLERCGTPAHPSDLADHACLSYTNVPMPEVWQFTSIAGDEVTVAVRGPLRTNSGEAMLPALRRGLGIARLPGFIVDEDIDKGRLVTLLPEWMNEARGINLVTPPGKHRPARVAALVEFLARRVAMECAGSDVFPAKSQ